MDSVFNFIQCDESFWVKAKDPAPSSVLKTGVLRLSTANSRENVLCKLTNTQLFRSASEHRNSVCQFSASLRWRVLLPFEESNETGTAYGFSLVCNQSKVDFYVESQDDLHEWLDLLEGICILTDLAEDYAVKNEIGNGGQATVYMAESYANGETVAVKRFDKDLLEKNRKRVVALAREIEVLRDFQHPRALRLHRVYEDEHAVYLITEYIAGEDMFMSLSQRGKFSASEAERFIAKFLDFLRDLEQRQLLHRDLKPENILLTNALDRSEFKVIDFGFALKHTGHEVCESCGSLGYLAPEIILYRKHGPTVDIYSAGIIFFIILSGYSPFYAGSKEEVLRLNARGEVKFSKKWEGVDPVYVRLVATMTALDPQQRQSAARLKDLHVCRLKTEATVTWLAVATNNAV